MPREPVALAIADLSAFARSIETQLARLGRMPGHVQMLNMLARAAGFANFQHLQAGNADPPPGRAPDPPPLETARIARAANHFDATGRLASWPSRPSVQTLCMWVLWSHIPPGAIYDERSFSAWLNQWHLFGDAAMLRREMWVKKMIHRSPRGTDYYRLGATPPPELAPLLERVGRSGPASVIG